MPRPPQEGHYEMMAGVRLSVCRVPRANSRTERPAKIGTMEAHHIYRSKGQRSRSPGRLILSQTMQHTDVGGNSRDAKVKVKPYSIK